MDPEGSGRSHQGLLGPCGPLPSTFPSSAELVLFAGGLVGDGEPVGLKCGVHGTGPTFCGGPVGGGGAFGVSPGCSILEVGGARTIAGTATGGGPLAGSREGSGSLCGSGREGDSLPLPSACSLPSP